MIPLEFPEQALPHGLKNCRLLQFAVDYVRRGAVAQLAVDVTEGDGDLKYRTARLLFTEIVFCSLDAPTEKSETNERELWVPDVYVLEKADLSKHPFGAWVEEGHAWALDLADIESSMVIVGAMCRFEWTGEI